MFGVVLCLSCNTYLCFFLHVRVENLAARVLETFAAPMADMMAKAYFETEQEANRVDNAVEDAHESAKECQQMDSNKNTRQDAKSILIKLDKIIDKCNIEFGSIARQFSLIALAGTDQTAAQLAVKTLSDLHRAFLVRKHLGYTVNISFLGQIIKLMFVKD